MSERTYRIKYPDGRTLLELLKEQGAVISAPCGGNGRCGRCVVSMDGEEVLACRTVPDAECTVVVPEPVSRILEAPEDPKADGADAAALAVDLGTTTIAAALLDGNGRIIKTMSRPNSGAVYGADVVSRIEAAVNGKADELRALAIKDVASFAGSGIRTVICGNTAMEHIYAGLPLDGLATAPYCAAALEELRRGNVTLMPVIGPFTGADMLAGIALCGLGRDGARRAFIDIGTNGEIAVSGPNGILVSSAAAGPAFEGGSLSCGMQASQGAITTVAIAGRICRAQTVGGGPAAGICGSGIMSLIAGLRRNGIIDVHGTLAEDFSQSGYPLPGGLFFTQRDIRKVQAAKAAVRAGLDVLIELSGVRTDDIEALYIAGGFGSHIDTADAADIGLIDPALADRTYYAGNTSLKGAIDYAFGRLSKGSLGELRKKIKEISLADEPKFAAEYTAMMEFA